MNCFFAIFFNCSQYVVAESAAYASRNSTVSGIPVRFPSVVTASAII